MNLLGWHGIRPRRPRTALATAGTVLAVAFAAVGCGEGESDSDDGSGRTTVVLRPAGSGATAEQLDRTRDLLEKRLEAAGEDDASVAVDGDRITLSVPASSGDLLAGIERPGRLAFRPVLTAETSAPGGPGPSGTPGPSGAPSPSGAPGGAGSAGTLPAGPTGSTPAPVDLTAPMTPSSNGAPPSDLPAGMAAAFAALDCADTSAATGTAGNAAATLDGPALACAQKAKDGVFERYILGPALLDGGDLTKAQAQMSENAGGWEVALKFDTEGTGKFAAVTGDLASGKYPTNRFAVTLDGRVILAPTVSESLPGGSAVITGAFTKTDAKQLAAMLSEGALPLDLVVASKTAG
ncbi:SecDF P1 head subdomain-containing protein [Yinghuangia soli]|uniref:SecDF P1 head subdomain domain-containing protein n=1 Tax=Yinghuangia soli TaxID=2908204 RepID=A0AA41Q651_9ACTN|nr:hypothetical protein [Yinghuangia soli]MCF2531971.1 hypothetical protein [Yinghuangia soli]